MKRRGARRSPSTRSRTPLEHHHGASKIPIAPPAAVQRPQTGMRTRSQSAAAQPRTQARAGTGSASPAPGLRGSGGGSSILSTRPVLASPKAQAQRDAVVSPAGRRHSAALLASICPAKQFPSPGLALTEQRPPDEDKSLSGAPTVSSLSTPSSGMLTMEPDRRPPLCKVQGLQANNSAFGNIEATVNPLFNDPPDKCPASENR
eukprot:evm.model.scf_2789.1 EVM.evm.TU.scf_2789.1   scf_2789:14590-17222(+)